MPRRCSSLALAGLLFAAVAIADTTKQPLVRVLDGAGNPVATVPALQCGANLTCVKDPVLNQVNMSATGGAGTGTVTSVGVTVPAELNVSGSPITTAGTFGFTWAPEAVGAVFAGPTTGAPATPGFRPLVASDVPTIAESQVTSLVADLAAKATAATTISTTTPLTGGGDLSAPRTFGLAGLSGFGTANQLLGMNAGATAYEYKTVQGVANETDVTQGAGTLTVGLVDPLLPAKGGTGANNAATLGRVLQGDGANFVTSPRIPLSGGVDISTQSGIDCTGATDSTTGVTNAIAAASGGMLWIPSGCRLLIASPGATGTTNFTVPSHTKIVCADPTAGFTLARRVCAGGATYPGSSCAVAGDCAGTGATCVVDGSLGGPWAGTSSTDARTLFAAAASAINPEFRNCGIFANGMDPYKQCFTGAGSCSAAAGTSARGNQCPCDNNNDCASALCTASDNYAYPVGQGKVDLVDFSNATGAVIADNVVYDHHYGDFSVKGGILAQVLRNRLEQSSVNVLGDTCVKVDVGIQTDDPLNKTAPTYDYGDNIGSLIVGNQVRAQKYGIKVGNFSLVDGNQFVEGNQCAFATIKTIAFFATGQQTRFTNNFASSGYTCVQGDALGALNITFANNRCYNQAGPKVRISLAGWIVSGNYLAWGSGSGPSTIVEMGDPGEKDCLGAGNPYDGCTGAGTGQVAGLGATHPIIAGNLLYSATANEKWITVPDIGKRCTGSTNWPALKGMACSVGNCASGSCQANGTCVTGGAACCDDAGGGGVCSATSVDNGEILGNILLTGSTGTVGIDLSGLTSGNTTVTAMSIQSNQIGQVTGVKFPASPVAGTFQSVRLANNAFINDTTGIANFPWTGGNTQIGNAGLTATEDQVATVNLTNHTGGTAVAGNFVDADSTQDNSFLNGTIGSAVHLGVLMDAPATGALGQVAVNGVVRRCNTASAVARGDKLKISTTAGQLETANPGDDVVAVAVTASSSNICACAVGPFPQNSLAKSKPSDQGVTNSSTIVDDTALQLTLAPSRTYAITGTIRVVQGASATPNFKMQFDLPSAGSALLNAVTYTAATTFNYQTLTNASPITVTIGSSVTATINVSGTVTVGSTGGAFKFRWAQGTATAGITTTVKAGSYLAAAVL